MMTKRINATSEKSSLDDELRRTIKSAFSQFEQSRSVSDEVFRRIDEEESKKNASLISRIKARVFPKI